MDAIPLFKHIPNLFSVFSRLNSFVCRQICNPFRHGVCYFQAKSPDILPIVPCVHLSRVEEIPLHAHICPCFCSIKHNEIFPLPYSVILDILFSGAVPLVVLDVLIEACSSTAAARLFLFFPKYIAENLVLFISAFSLE